MTQLYVLFFVFACPVPVDTFGTGRSQEQGVLTDVYNKLHKLEHRDALYHFGVQHRIYDM